MRRRRFWFWAGFFVVSAAAIGTGSYALFSPKIGSATAAEIDARLPASLKVQDAPDPKGEVRYRELTDLAHLLNTKPLKGASSPANPSEGVSLPENEQILAKVDRLLEEGSLRIPARTRNTILPDLLKLKNVAKLISVSLQAAKERGDRTACLRWATLGIRYGDALKSAGGVAIDQLVAIAIEAIPLRTIYLTELDNGFGPEGEARMIALLQPGDGSSPEMADAVRRDFLVDWGPLLHDPQGHVEELLAIADVAPPDDWSDPSPEKSERKPCGTFDPRATAELAGRLYDGIISDLRGVPTKAVHADERLIKEAEKGLPVTDGRGGLGGWMYRIKMNLGFNTIGRTGVAGCGLGSLTHAVARDAANRNLIRAVFILRSGGTPAVADPLGKGNLLFDRKRMLVWSVGKDGRNDGGLIDRGYSDSAPDLGYPYGDHSWAALHPPLPGFPASGPPAGFPPGP